MASVLVANPFDDVDNTTSTPTTTSLRHQLHNLLPRHTYFNASLIIHQITNVPFVSGDFAVRWKFKNVHAPPRNSSKLLDIVKGKSSSSSRSPLNSSSTLNVSKGKGKAREDHDDDADSNSQESIETPASLLSTHIDPSPSRARGQTQFVSLKDHSASWDNSIQVIVRFDIDRSDSATLLPSPLKLVVSQPHREDSNPRLGAVYLDLAQYAEKGQVVRRYLLRESKTNALLKLSIQLTHIYGPTNFQAPLLPKGEILNGISGIVLENNVYRTRPKGLDLYGPYHDLQELEHDLLNNDTDSDDDDNPETATPNNTTKRRTFDPERLPLAYGPKTTETLIEAIFNPVKTTEKRRESPFTLLVSSLEEEPLSPPQVLHLNRPPGAQGGLTVGVGVGVGGRGKKFVAPPSPLRSAPPSSTFRGVVPPSPLRGTPPPHQQTPRSGSGIGIGAGLGIMGLGLGMGIGMGVGVGVEAGSGAGASTQNANANANGKHKPQIQTPKPAYASSVRTTSSGEEGASVGMRSVSASAWSTEGEEGWSESSHSHSYSPSVSVEGEGEAEGEGEGEKGKKGVMRGWWRKRAHASASASVKSRPGTPASASIIDSNSA